MDIESVKALVISFRLNLQEDSPPAISTLEAAAEVLEELVALLESGGANNLKAFWEGLTPGERKALRQRAGKATWAKNSKADMQRKQREGHARETPEARSERSRKGAEAMHAKYDDDVKNEWRSRGGKARAARRRETDATE